MCVLGFYLCTCKASRFKSSSCLLSLKPRLCLVCLLALMKAAQGAQKMLDFTLRDSVPICLASVLTQKLRGSDKQGHVTFINKTGHD